MAGFLEAAHELVKEHHFAGRHNKAVHGIAVIVGAAKVSLRALKQKRMVAALLQLCDDVQQADLGAPLRALYPPSHCIQHVSWTSKTFTLHCQRPERVLTEPASANCANKQIHEFQRLRAGIPENNMSAGQALSVQL